MSDETTGQEQAGVEAEAGSLTADAYEAEDILAGAEEWSRTETWLVVGSFLIALVALAVGGALINIYILP